MLSQYLPMPIEKFNSLILGEQLRIIRKIELEKNKSINNDIKVKLLKESI